MSQNLTPVNYIIIEFDDKDEETRIVEKLLSNKNEKNQSINITQTQDISLYALKCVEKQTNGMGIGDIGALAVARQLAVSHDTKKEDDDDIYVEILPDDEIPDDDEMPTKSRRTKRITCQQCFASLLPNRNHLNDHALAHTSFKIFKCMVPSCNFEGNHKRTVMNHIARTHSMEVKYFDIPRVERTEQEMMEIKKMFDHCFPNWNR